MTKFVVYDPVAPEPAAELTSSARPTTSFYESRAVAYTNLKQHATEAMQHIIDGLSPKYGVINVGTVSRPVTNAPDPEMLDKLAQDCDWVLVGSAD
jgi:hypothetical protein